MKTITHQQYLNLKSKFRVLLFAFVMIIFGFSTNIYPHSAEFRMVVRFGNGPMQVATINLYSLKSYLMYSGSSQSTVRGEILNNVDTVNFVADVTDGPSFLDDPDMEPVEPSTYLLRISNKYCILYIPTFNSNYNADFVLKFDGYVFTRLDNPTIGRQITISPTYTWTGYDVIVKNSFNVEGTMLLDGSNFTIPAGGRTFNWEQSSFPHVLSAIDQKPTTFNFWQRFTDWSTGSANRTISISAGDGIYQANFRNEYNITFQNSFSGASGGIISVNGQQVNAPYNTTALQYTGVNAIALYNNINGISYSFTQWNDGISMASRHFYPTDHTTYTAYYVGRPNNQYRNLHFLASDPNAPITLLWNDHPNTNVTEYQIWRKSKYKKQATSQPILLGTVNRGTTSFIDYDFAGTTSGFTDWVLWYDVKAYFQPDNTYSLDDFVQVFSDGLLPKISGNNSEIITENKIDNYPNPFNPATVISYQLVNSGYVSLKIYDIIGNEIAVLVDEIKSSGIHQVYFNANGLSSGIYIYRIIANGYSESKKMILSK